MSNFQTLSKKKKILIISLISVFGALVLATAVFGIVVAVRERNPAPLTDAQRKILLMRGDPVDYTPLGMPLAREIGPDRPVNVITYYGDADGIAVLWRELPDDIKEISVLLLIKGNILAPGGSPQSLIDLADACDRQQIPYLLQLINGETHFEWIIPLTWIEREFCHRPYCYGVNTAELYNGEEWRGQLDGDVAWYLNDSIRLMAKYGKFVFITDTNKFGTYGTFSDWIEENEYLYTTMQECAPHIYMQNKESYGDPSSYSLMKGLYLAGLIGGWGVSTDWWHWQVSNYKVLFHDGKNNIDSSWEQIYYYPEIMQTMSLAMVAANGGFCFKNEAEFYSVAVNGSRTATFQWCTIPFFRALSDGTVRIPSREELLATEKVAVVGAKNYRAVNYDLKESTLYPDTPDFAILSLLPGNLRQAEIDVFDTYNIQLIDKKADAKALAPYAYSSARGNTYMSVVGRQWLYLNNCENVNRQKSATAVALRHDGVEVGIESGPHGYVFFTEHADRLTFSMNNYRVDKYRMISELDGTEQAHDALREWVGVNKETNTIKATDTTLRTTVISVRTPVKPTLRFHDVPDEIQQNVKPFRWEESYQNGVYTLRVAHNGYVAFDLGLPPCAVSDEPPSKSPANNNLLSVNDTYDYEKVQNILAHYAEIGQNATLYSETAFAAYRKAYSLLETALTYRTVSSDAIDDAVAFLEKTPLLQTEKYYDLLRDKFSAGLTDGNRAAFDRLLREVLSPTQYYNHKDKTLKTYFWTRRKAYTTSVYKMKEKALDKYGKQLQSV